jgi:hypothetical protein
MRFTAFVQKGDFAREVIAWLLADLQSFPADAARTTSTIYRACGLRRVCFPDGKPDRPGAMTLAACY